VTHDEVFCLSIDEIYTLCDLAEKATVDVTVYWIISTMCASLNSRAAKRTYTGNQRADLIAKMSVLVGNKFPTPGFIAHDGYLILSMISINQLERYSRGAWEDIHAKALAIPNVADRCLVLADLAGAVSKHDNEWAVSILRECQKFAEEIPSALDRAGRLEMMAREAYKVNKELSRELFTQALRMTVNDNEPEYDGVRRDIVDSAHQISPDLASSIASALDDDQARRAKRGVSSRMELLDLRRKLVDPRGEEDELPEGAARRLSEASWALLGSLNSARVIPLKVSRTRPYLEHAAKLPFNLLHA
jgi:hypothetical protein